MNNYKEISNSFSVLSYQDERKLSVDEKVDYFKELRKYCQTRPLNTTTKGARKIAPKLRNITIKLAGALIPILANNKNVIHEVDGYENVPDGPVIFARAHSGVLDNFVWIPESDRHCIILHSAETNKFLLVCQLNTGLVLVKKGNKQNNYDAKLDMIRLLMEGHSITYFPESAWNLSPNKLMLPMSYGFMDVACKAKVPVVPVVHEYSYDTSTGKERITKIHSRYGKPIYVSEEDDLGQKLAEYVEVMATMRWDLVAEKGLFERSKVSNWEYINYLKGNYKNHELGKIDTARERNYVYGAKDDFYLFHHIIDVPWDAWGNLLETDEVRKLKEINRKHL